jgi:hypothetical protein
MADQLDAESDRGASVCPSSALSSCSRSMPRSRLTRRSALPSSPSPARMRAYSLPRSSVSASSYDSQSRGRARAPSCFRHAPWRLFSFGFGPQFRFPQVLPQQPRRRHAPFRPFAHVPSLPWRAGDSRPHRSYRKLGGLASSNARVKRAEVAVEWERRRYEIFVLELGFRDQAPRRASRGAAVGGPRSRPARRLKRTAGRIST